MKRIWKYIGIGLLTVILEWIFVAWVYAFFDGMAQSERIVLGTGFFLAFEMVICTGVIVSRIGSGKTSRPLYDCRTSK